MDELFYFMKYYSWLFGGDFFFLFVCFALMIIPPGVISVFNYNLCVYVSGTLPFCKWMYAVIVN